MADESLSEGGPTASICPWCSASYTGDPENCPSCSATLSPDPAIDPSLPGLTAIDTAAIVRSKTPVNKPRNRLLSWISGEYPDEGVSTKDAAALAPPDQAVRREILRLELEAEVANLQAEADAILAEAAVEGRVPASAAGAPSEEAGDAVAVAEAAPDVAPETAADSDPEAPKA
ncbi:MAG: hypothetical protein ACSLFN_11785 [Candidatus Limnocylindrales bacterium]